MVCHTSSHPCHHRTRHTDLLLTSPVKGLHFEGLYLHNGELADRYHGFFGASNPPPDVKEAFDRCQRYEGLAADYDIVRYFCQCHGPFERELCRLDYWER